MGPETNPVQERVGFFFGGGQSLSAASSSLFLLLLLLFELILSIRYGGVKTCRLVVELFSKKYA